jgi:ribonuclease VapC
MVIDTSAVVAILLNEPGCERFTRALNEAPYLAISAASVLEISLVIDSRFGARAAGMLDRWLESAPVEIVAVTPKQVTIAREGFRQFGKGKHPAALNFGDCFSYSLAKASGDRLLYQGSDFSQTDILPALPTNTP